MQPKLQNLEALQVPSEVGVAHCLGHQGEDRGAARGTNVAEQQRRSCQRNVESAFGTCSRLVTIRP